MEGGDGRRKADGGRVRRLGPAARPAEVGARGTQALTPVLGLTRLMRTPHLTVCQWLRLYERAPQEAGAVLFAAIHRVAGRKRGQSAEEAAARALDGNAKAVRRAHPSTPLPAWVNGCVANVWREMCVARQKERARIEEVPDPAPCPLDVAERNEDRGRVLHAASLLSRPLGHVVVWCLIEGLPSREIRDRLNEHRTPGSRPIGDRQVRKLIQEAVEAVKDVLAGVDPREAHPQRYLARKNPWIGSALPPLSHIPNGGPARCGPRVGGRKAVPARGRATPGKSLKPEGTVKSACIQGVGTPGSPRATL